MSLVPHEFHLRTETDKDGNAEAMLISVIFAFSFKTRGRNAERFCLSTIPAGSTHLKLAENAESRGDALCWMKVGVRTAHTLGQGHG